MKPVQFYKCLADETRLKILLLLHRERELCVCELTEALQEIQPKISRHLAYLKLSGLLLDRRQGQWVFYRLNGGLPDWTRKVLQETIHGNDDFLQQCTKHLSRMSGRPERTSVCC